jgi:hypothetical protein
MTLSPTRFAKLSCGRKYIVRHNGTQMKQIRQIRQISTDFLGINQKFGYEIYIIFKARYGLTNFYLCKSVQSVSSVFYF